jgi:hypothetical protein
MPPNRAGPVLPARGGRPKCDAPHTSYFPQFLTSRCKTLHFGLARPPNTNKLLRAPPAETAGACCTVVLPRRVGLLCWLPPFFANPSPDCPHLHAHPAKPRTHTHTHSPLCSPACPWLTGWGCCDWFSTPAPRGLPRPPACAPGCPRPAPRAPVCVTARATAATAVTHRRAENTHHKQPTRDAHWLRVRGPGWRPPPGSEPSAAQPHPGGGGGGGGSE